LNRSSRLEISLLRSKKAYGLYSSPIRVLKEDRSFITLRWAYQPLCSNWKVSFQVKTCKNYPSIQRRWWDRPNYRPISLLSVSNRIFERIMYNRLKSYIEDDELLYKAQYGFRETFSIQHAILDIVSTMQTNMDKKMLTTTSKPWKPLLIMG